MSAHEFSLAGYEALVRSLVAQGYQAVGFDNAVADQKHLVLRHDVDMCLQRAVELAEREEQLGVRSTYFVLVRTEMYAVTSRRSRAALARLLALGREVGLHFDAEGLGDDPAALERAADADCTLLESVLGEKVRAVSFHRPAKSLQGWPSPIAGRPHAYQPRFFSEMGYCSDSEGQFRFGHPLDHAAVKDGRAFQLVTHPIWWVAGGSETVLEKLERFRRDRDQLMGEELAFNCKPYRGVVGTGQPIPSFQLGARSIGVGDRCFVIAEAGVNHNGDLALAHRLIDVAAAAGADAVKFQTFEPDLLVSSTAQQAAYQVKNTGKAEAQKSMLERLVLPRPAHVELKKHAEERGLLFLSTPFDLQSADFLEELGVHGFKVASGDLTNLPFIEALARKGRPLLLSSGMATLTEVAQAVDAIRATSGVPIGLFHCVTNYPAAPVETNLRAMETMRAAFRVPTGLSDHSAGLPIGLAAVARGAQLLEKHFTLDRNLPGPDHMASLEPRELEALIAGLRDIEAALGTGQKVPQPSEVENARVARKSLHALRALPAGHPLTVDDLIALRPGDGISPARLRNVVGKRLKRAMAQGEKLVDELVEG